VSVWLEGALALRTFEVNLLCCLVDSGLAALLIALDLLRDVVGLVLLLAA
jgi:hypothetical protein